MKSSANRTMITSPLGWRQCGTTMPHRLRITWQSG
jgi:hypothetical protein